MVYYFDAEHLIFLRYLILFLHMLVSLASGDPADVVLLDADPYAADTPEAMRAMPQHVVMTLLCGERTY